MKFGFRMGNLSTRPIHLLLHQEKYNVLFVINNYKSFYVIT